MLDDKDVEKLIKAQKEVFVTKEEFESLIDIVATKDELNAVKTDINKIGETLEKMDKKLDEVVKVKKLII